MTHQCHYALVCIVIALMVLFLSNFSGLFLTQSFAHSDNFQGDYYTLNWKDQHYHIGYNISTGGQIDKIILKDHHFEIHVSSQTNSEMFLTIPRALFTSVWLEPYYDGYYESVQVIDDNGELLNIPDKVVDCHSVDMVIPIRAGSNNIRIIAASQEGISSRSIGGYNMTFPLIVGGEEFVLPIQTNSYHCDLQFRTNEKSLIALVIGGPERWEGERGFFAVTVPHKLISGNHTVMIDGEYADFDSEINQKTNSTQFQLQYDIDDFNWISILGTETAMNQTTSQQQRDECRRLGIEPSQCQDVNLVARSEVWPLSPMTPSILVIAIFIAAVTFIIVIFWRHKKNQKSKSDAILPAQGTEQRTNRNTTLALILGIVLSGLGHIYLGYVKRGISILIGGVVLTLALNLFFGLVGVLFGIGYWAWQLYDLYKRIKT